MDANEAEESPPDVTPSNDDRRRFEARRRLVIALSVFYVLVGFLVVATFYAYPELFFSDHERRIFFRENYQFIVAAVAGVGALITLSIISPKTVVSLSNAFIPSKAFASAVADVVSAASVSAVGLGASFSRDDPHSNQFQSSDENFVFPVIGREISADDVIGIFILRMRKEEARLKDNALSNLIWGVVFAAAGIAVLSYPLFFPDSLDKASISAFVISYIPRGALAITVALLSFFFLRLYASNEYDLKHTKNELSTMEGRIIAAKIACSRNSDVMIQSSIDSLSSYERNFVLKSGEKTISTEVDTRYNDIVSLLNQIIVNFPKTDRS